VIRLALAAALVLAGCVADTYLAGPWDAAVPVCGDGVLDVGEQCDDGNTTSGDGCSATCTLEVEDCGNGIDDDDGLVDCADTDCTGDPACPFCGDGEFDPGEECDDGNGVSGDGCSATCKLEVEVTCDDRVDNDEDGQVDCADPDCEGQTCGIGLACRGTECL